LKKVNTMEEFAALAGVSRPTASKYFENPLSVGARSREKIESTLKTVDYRPNLLASRLMRKESRMIGVLIPSLGDPFYAAIARAIERHAMLNGYSVLIESSHGQAEVEERSLDNFLALKVAGICYAPAGIKAFNDKLSRIQQNTPLVFIDAKFDGVKFSVQNNNHQSIGLITDYMIESGRQPAFFPMPNVNNSAKERLLAYQNTMAAHQLTPNVLDVNDEDTWDFEEWGWQEALRLIRCNQLTDQGVICANDRIAFGVISALFSEGMISSTKDPMIQVPITGHDNQPLSKFTCPPLTTVQQDIEGMGRYAFEKILKLATGQVDDRADHILLDAKLVIRASA
jgi:LacI family transcriptional regulator, repressor for deo operon, udp, cdd, tsx, nupC, and nupG